MRKRGLQDVKRRNRQVVVEAVMESGGLSRVEITQKTELAPSTVSALTAQLLAEGILKEGDTVVTAGRSRTELMVNPDHGTIAVVEISRKQSYISFFDMTLGQLHTQVLGRWYVSGNELLGLIVQCLDTWQKERPVVMGIGLLFQEDMRESDFRVMYSTGFASASITLKEALVTQYRIPVEEEYSVTYTVSNALAVAPELETRNSAHICVGSRVLAKVTLEGREVPLRTGSCEELAPLITREEDVEKAGISDYLAKLICLLCVLFPLDTVFLTGLERLPEENACRVEKLTRDMLDPGKMPKLTFLQGAPLQDTDWVLAGQVLKRVLLAR